MARVVVVVRRRWGLLAKWIILLLGRRGRSVGLLIIAAKLVVGLAGLRALILHRLRCERVRRRLLRQRLLLLLLLLLLRLLLLLLRRRRQARCLPWCGNGLLGL